MVKRTSAIPDRPRKAAVAAPPAREPDPSVEQAIVAVQSEWNGWRTARVCVAALEDIHWAQPPGAPRRLVHAVVPCDRLQAGQIEHHCRLTPPPHRLLVCVLKSHTQSAVFAELARRADAAPGGARARQGVPAAGAASAGSPDRLRLLGRVLNAAGAMLRGGRITAGSIRPRP